MNTFFIRAGSLGLLLLLLPAITAGAALRNQLSDHGSAYLAMHGEDPVHWQQWNAKTVALAKKQNKLLYVSSGYFSCHWCHVMQKESYQNPQIAELLNTHFIPVKVDRELNPALDDRLIDFVERTQGYSGWPLNAFVTPQGYPLTGMVYQPREEFRQILERLRDQWQDRAAELKQLAQRSSRELASNTPTPRDTGVAQLREQLNNACMQRADELQGGFGDQNKFPSVPQLNALLELERQNSDDNRRAFLHTTLQAMAEQGLYDHLAGGFFRYTVDPGWQVPHFEKMLYDNALLASLYLRAAEQLDEPAYQQVGLETLAFMQQEFQRNSGGLLASFSALDDQGIEGGYYLWRESQLKQTLNASEFQVARRIWGVSGPPELEHGHHLHLASSITSVASALDQTPGQISIILEQARRKLSKQRRQRTLPKDSKQIAAWNGLALTALVDGARHEARFARGASRLRNFIVVQLWDGKRLKRAGGGQQQLGRVGLEDYAYVAQGLLDYADFRDHPATRKVVGKLLHQAWQRFFSPQGWLLQQQPLLKYGARQAVLSDGPMPSPSATLIAATRQYVQQQPDPGLEKSLEQALTLHEAAVEASPFWYASHIIQLR